jgi:CBS-domain-containing membrane protein
LPDLLEAIKTRQGDNVAAAMRAEFPTATAGEEISAAQERLAESGARAMPVIDDGGRLVGLLTAIDITELVSLLSALQTAAASGNGVLSGATPTAIAGSIRRD